MVGMFNLVINTTSNCWILNLSQYNIEDGFMSHFESYSWCSLLQKAVEHVENIRDNPAKRKGDKDFLKQLLILFIILWLNKDFAKLWEFRLIVDIKSDSATLETK